MVVTVIVTYNSDCNVSIHNKMINITQLSFLSDMLNQKARISRSNTMTEL